MQINLGIKFGHKKDLWLLVVQAKTLMKSEGLPVFKSDSTALIGVADFLIKNI